MSTKNTLEKMSDAVCRFVLLAAFSASVIAAPLDDISVQQQGDVALVKIKLTTPVHFLRYVPGSKSRIVEIYYERIPSSDATDSWVDGEERRHPATANIPAFTVTTRDQAVQPKLVVAFAKDVEFKVSAGADNRSFVMTIKPEQHDAPMSANVPPQLPTVLPPVREAATATPATPDAAENNQQAYTLMLAGRDALSAKNYSAATETFNKLLMLPPNQYSQDAQEWVGVARERGGQVEKAKVEYELYLKLYPTGQGALWVKQRLAGLAIATPAVKAQPIVKKVENRNLVQGGISSRYYFGQSKLDTTYPINNGIQATSLTLKDQSMIISNVDATGRFISEDYDNRIVFRDMSIQNLIPGQASRNRVNSAYVEMKNRPAELTARVGRQTPNGGGVMGRFDGVFAGYGAPQDFRISGVAGQIVDFTFMPQPIFYGLSVESGPVSAYLINQTLEGVQDRRALGAEYRYFKAGNTAYALLDYDLYFKVLNAATINGMIANEASGTTYNFMADYRKSPSISIRNSLNGALTTSVKDLLATMDAAQLKQLAVSRTGSYAYTQFGVTQKLHAKWQVGGDVKLTKTAGLPASGADPTNCQDPANTAACLQGYIASYPDTGLEKTLTGQLVGSNLYSEADITSLGASYIASDYVKNGQSFFVYNRTSFNRKFSLDSSWNFYKQADNFGGSMARNMPMLRVAYQMGQQLSFDADLGLELTSTFGAYQTTKSSRTSFSLGFRWDF